MTTVGSSLLLSANALIFQVCVMCITYAFRINPQSLYSVMSAIVLMCPHTVVLWLTGRVLKSLDVAFEAEHSSVAMLSATTFSQRVEENIWLMLPLVCQLFVF